MDILNFVKKFDLHDSTIENIGHEFFEGQLIITINLCNWRQLTFENGQQENVVGNLIFSDISEVEIDPKKFTCDSNEIIEVKHEQSNRDKIVIIFHAERDKEIVELSFKAKEVEWVPLEYS